MKFNEDSRVKIPAILHLVRLGYKYLSLNGLVWDETCNIVPSIFRDSISAINPHATASEIANVLSQISLILDNEDLGKEFYERLTQTSGIKILDFENFDRNTFHVVTEFTCKKDDEEFRPDITLLINGMPLVFIEVKKPNNREGIIAERDRILRRFRNSKFKRFINITQLMVFSNNMEYEDGSPEPLQGAFYASTSYGSPAFNYFREEETQNLAQLLQPEDEAVEDYVLADTNLASIKHSPEFSTNKSPSSPTNRLCTSLFSRDRFAFLLRFALAYVKIEHGYEKHVMRYPQIFATKAIENKIENGVRKGIIWHTQGSGKTALAFYNVHYLTAYFQKKGVIPKFYFIVDRIDLLDQASREFLSRGLHVHHINSRDEFAADIKSNVAIHNDSGKPEITVVNIQRFKDDPDVIRSADQRGAKAQVECGADEPRAVAKEWNQPDFDRLGGSNLLSHLIRLHRDGSVITFVLCRQQRIASDYVRKFMNGDGEENLLGVVSIHRADRLDTTHDHASAATTPARSDCGPQAQVEVGGSETVANAVSAQVRRELPLADDIQRQVGQIDSGDGVAK